MAKTAEESHINPSNQDIFLILGEILHEYMGLAEWEDVPPAIDQRFHMVFNAGFLHAVLLCHEYPKVRDLLVEFTQKQRGTDSTKVVDKSAQQFWERLGDLPLSGNELLQSLVSVIDHPDNHGDQDGVPLKIDVADDGWAWDVMRPGDKVVPDVREGEQFGTH